ncbi:hypothetical protein [Methanosarcina sp.]|uniref:hypothetical protein n=1 Tax=Methanosarcina sp. TaxID=2213 RepID=UPI003C7294BE
MSIPQPDLYIKKYKDISDELLESIPKYTEKWTNHNPSDPGIVILEMLAWITDTTLYRIDRTPEEMYVSFLRLVAGSAGLEDVKNLLETNPDCHYKKILTLLKKVESGEKISIEEIKSTVFTFLGSRFRAVTEEDFQMLAIEATDESPHKVKRAIVSAKGKKVEIIVVPDNWHELLKAENHAGYEGLIKIVSDYLDPRRLIGTAIDIKRPAFTEVKIYMKIDISSKLNNDKVTKKIKEKICNFLDPIVGGDQGNGWPYGRSLTIYEIAQVIENTEGVEKIYTVNFDGNDKLEVKEAEGFFDPTVIIEPKEYNVTFHPL